MFRKLLEWTYRYLPMEIFGTLSALLSALIVERLTHNLLCAAIAGTWGENLGFYGYALIREGKGHFKPDASNPDESKPKGFIAPALKTIRDIVLEFGIAEALDSFLLRPFFMWLFPILTGQLLLGLFMGKLAADVFFYVPTILCFEMKKRFLGAKKPRQKLLKQNN